LDPAADRARLLDPGGGDVAPAVETVLPFSRNAVRIFGSPRRPGLADGDDRSVAIQDGHPRAEGGEDRGLQIVTPAERILHFLAGERPGQDVGQEVEATRELVR